MIPTLALLEVRGITLSASVETLTALEGESLSLNLIKDEKTVVAQTPLLAVTKSAANSPDSDSFSQATFSAQVLQYSVNLQDSDGKVLTLENFVINSPLSLALHSDNKETPISSCPLILRSFLNVATLNVVGSSVERNEITLTMQVNDNTVVDKHFSSQPTSSISFSLSLLVLAGYSSSPRKEIVPPSDDDDLRSNADPAVNLSMDRSETHCEAFEAGDVEGLAQSIIEKDVNKEVPRSERCDSSDRDPANVVANSETSLNCLVVIEKPSDTSKERNSGELTREEIRGIGGVELLDEDVDEELDSGKGNGELEEVGEEVEEDFGYGDVFAYDELEAREAEARTGDLHTAAHSAALLPIPFPCSVAEDIDQAQFVAQHSASFYEQHHLQSQHSLLSSHHSQHTIYVNQDHDNVNNNHLYSSKSGVRRGSASSTFKRAHDQLPSNQVKSGMVISSRSGSFIQTSSNSQSNHSHQSLHNHYPAKSSSFDQQHPIQQHVKVQNLHTLQRHSSLGSVALPSHGTNTISSEAKQRRNASFSGGWEDKVNSDINYNGTSSSINDATLPLKQRRASSVTANCFAALQPAHTNKPLLHARRRSSAAASTNTSYSPHASANSTPTNSGVYLYGDNTGQDHTLPVSQEDTFNRRDRSVSSDQPLTTNPLHLRRNSLLASMGGRGGRLGGRGSASLLQRSVSVDSTSQHDNNHAIHPDMASNDPSRSFLHSLFAPLSSFSSSSLSPSSLSVTHVPMQWKLNNLGLNEEGIRLDEENEERSEHRNDDDAVDTRSETARWITTFFRLATQEIRTLRQNDAQLNKTAESLRAQLDEERRRNLKQEEALQAEVLQWKSAALHAQSQLHSIPSSVESYSIGTIRVEMIPNQVKPSQQRVSQAVQTENEEEIDLDGDENSSEVFANGNKRRSLVLARELQAQFDLAVQTINLQDLAADYHLQYVSNVIAEKDTVHRARSNEDTTVEATRDTRTENPAEGNTEDFSTAEKFERKREGDTAEKAAVSRKETLSASVKRKKGGSRQRHGQDKNAQVAGIQHLLEDLLMHKQLLLQLQSDTLAREVETEETVRALHIENENLKVELTRLKAQVEAECTQKLKMRDSASHFLRELFFLSSSSPSDSARSATVDKGPNRSRTSSSSSSASFKQQSSITAFASVNVNQQPIVSAEISRSFSEGPTDASTPLPRHSTNGSSALSVTPVPMTRSEPIANPLMTPLPAHEASPRTFSKRHTAFGAEDGHGNSQDNRTNSSFTSPPFSPPGVQLLPRQTTAKKAPATAAAREGIASSSTRTQHTQSSTQVPTAYNVTGSNSGNNAGLTSNSSSNKGFSAADATMSYLLVGEAFFVPPQTPGETRTTVASSKKPITTSARSAEANGEGAEINTNSATPYTPSSAPGASLFGFFGLL